MFILEMMRSGELHPAYFAILLLMLCCTVMNVVLAKNKRRSLITASVLGLVPVVNMLSTLVYIGLPKKD